MAARTVTTQRTTQTRQTSSKNTTALTNAQQSEIALTAYQLWLDGGCQHGRDKEDWKKAETIVRSRLS